MLYYNLFIHYNLLWLWRCRLICVCLEKFKLCLFL